MSYNICPNCRREIPVGYSSCPYCKYDWGVKVDPSTLSPIYQRTLGAIVSIGKPGKIKVSDLFKKIGIDKPSIIKIISDLVNYRLISGAFDKKQNEFLLYGSNIPWKSLDDLRGKALESVGALQAYRKIKIRNLEKKVGLDQYTLRNLILELAGQGYFRVIMHQDEITLTYIPAIDSKKFFRHISQLDYRSKLFIGMILLHKKIKLDEIPKIIGIKDKIRIEEMIFTLLTQGFPGQLKYDTFTMTGELPLPLKEQKDLIFEGVKKKLFGVIIAHKELSLKEIAQRVSLRVEDVKKILYEFAIDGIIQGTIKNGNFYLKHYPYITPINYVYQLPLDQKLIAGMLLTHGKASLPEISKRLKMPIQKVRDFFYDLISNGTLMGSFYNNSFAITYAPVLTVRTPAQLGKYYPYLVDLLARYQRIKLKNLAKNLGIEKEAIDDMIYLLVAEGIIQGFIKKALFVLRGGPFEPKPVEPVVAPKEVTKTPEIYAEPPVSASVDEPIPERITTPVLPSTSIPIEELSIDELKAKKIALEELLLKLEGQLESGEISTDNYMRIYTRYRSDLALIDQKLARIEIEEIPIPDFEEHKCLFCGEKMPEGAELCPNCGGEREKCSVCLLDIEYGEDFAKCPECGVFSHSDHLLEWLKIKGFCPNCRTELKPEDVPTL